MNPHQKNKIDVKSLSPEEQRLFRLYGKLPSRSDHFAKHLKERKYFDSGDYALSKAGKADSVDTGAVGSEHPVPENIPHLTSPVNHLTSSGGGGGGVGSVGAGGNNGNGGVVGQQVGVQVGRLNVAGLPHLGVQAGSPVKESSFLNRETSADDVEGKEVERKEVSLPVRR